jgi:hypothetical protein
VVAGRRAWPGRPDWWTCHGGGGHGREYGLAVSHLCLAAPGRFTVRGRGGDGGVDTGRSKPYRIVERHRSLLGESERGERPRPIAKVNVGRLRLTDAIEAAGKVGRCEPHAGDPIRLRERQRPDQNCIDNGEHGCCSTRSDAQSQEDGHGECRSVDRGPKRGAKIWNPAHDGFSGFCGNDVTRSSIQRRMGVSLIDTATGSDRLSGPRSFDGSPRNSPGGPDRRRSVGTRMPRGVATGAPAGRPLPALAWSQARREIAGPVAPVRHQHPRAARFSWRSW